LNVAPIASTSTVADELRKKEKKRLVAELQGQKKEEQGAYKNPVRK